MNESPSESQKPDKKERNRKANKVLVPIVGVLFLIVIISLIASASGGNGKKVKYTATMPVDQFSVINPATLSVIFHITNTGNEAGSPTCQIEAEDVNYTYTGMDSVQMKPIQPGQTVTSVDNLTITKQGAQYVTQGKITCN